MSLRRRQFTRDFKLKLVQEYESGKGIAELSRLYEVNPSMVYRWRREAAQKDPGLRSRRQEESRIAELERLAGQLAWRTAF